MNANHKEETVPASPHTGLNTVRHGRDTGIIPVTARLGAVGQRRRDAEVKLEQHLQEARRKITPHDGTDGVMAPG